MTYAFAAAGTGGHIYPALAVADELVSRRDVAPSEVIFFGGSRLEREAVPAAGFELIHVEIRGLRRSLSRDNVAVPRMVLEASGVMRTTFRSRGTKVVAGFGGYVTGPAAVAARRGRVPLVIHEQNAVAGLANRLAARVATRVFATFPTTRSLHGAEVVGMPLRRAILDADRARLRPEARRGYGLDPDRPVLGVLGGSQGARILNEMAADLARDVADLQVLHLCGRNHADALAAAADGRPDWHVIGFEEAMERFYAAADLVVSRAGAATIAELAATGTPAIVVPYAAGTRDHQAANAAELAAAGGCVVVDESGLAAVRPLVEELLADEERLRAMAAAARSVARTDAASVIATAMQELAHG